MPTVGTGASTAITACGAVLLLGLAAVYVNHEPEPTGVDGGVVVVVEPDDGGVVVVVVGGVVVVVDEGGVDVDVGLAGGTVPLTPTMVSVAVEPTMLSNPPPKM